MNLPNSTFIDKAFVNDCGVAPCDPGVIVDLRFNIEHVMFLVDIHHEISRLKMELCRVRLCGQGLLTLPRSSHGDYGWLLSCNVMHN